MHVENPAIGKNIWPVMKSNHSKRLLPPKVSTSVAPNDREQNAPMTEHVMVIIIAPFFLLTFISS